MGFSKPFANLMADETAELVTEVGWDGIDCPVRSKAGQIAPERVEEELPKLLDALKKHGKELPMITTEITKVDPLAEKVLRTAARLGIKKYRLGFVNYAKNRPIPETRREFGTALKDLAGLNRDLGLQGGYQNHSGANYIGAPIWDVWTVIKDLPPEQIGICFDIAHATIEGGLSWPIEARLMEPFFVAVFLKDFRWEQTAKGWQPEWCNFGEGAVEKSFLTNLKKSSFTGPLCQHHEYPHGAGAEMIANFKRDIAKLRERLSAT
jgi:sugar phosphate isomerase/epimerase